MVMMGRTPALVRFAVEHPGKVRALILRHLPVDWLMEFAAQDWDVVFALMRHAPTGDPSGPMRRIEQTVTATDFRLRLKAWKEVRFEQLASGLEVPVLVLHTKANPPSPLEDSMALAASLPGAQLRIIEGDSYLGEVHEGMAEITSFLDEIDGAPAERPVATSSGLSAREAQVLQRMALGHTNRQIAEELSISTNTVQRHVSNIFTKLGLHNRAEAVAYALRHGIG
jgi:DNA-binding CsgD family transcriptional regulator